MKTAMMSGMKRALAATVCMAAYVCVPGVASAYDDERG